MKYQTLNKEIYPSTGIVSIKTLAQMAQINEDAIVKFLWDNDVNVLQFGTPKRTWFVRLEDLFGE